MPGRDSDSDSGSGRTTRPGYRPSEKVRVILAIAASSPDFLDMLVKNREKALARMGLSEEDKAALLSLSTERIVTIARRESRGAGPWRALKTRASLFAGIIVALIAFKLATSYGPARRAQAALVQLSIAENIYRARHRTYGSPDDLARSGVLKGEWVAYELKENKDYEFKVILEGDSFVATARHRRSPETQPGFRVGPDREVEELW